MALRTVRSGIMATIMALSVLNCTTIVRAMGYYNLPGSFCQCCGCGFGGGYHAPLVLGPIAHGYLSAPNVVRLPYAPNPYACAPSCCNSASNCSGEEPAMMARPVQSAAPQ